MKLQIDPEVVERLATEREDENWEFRSFLKNIDMSIKDLDAIVHRHYAAVSNRIDCCSCANCCRKAEPILNDEDVDRLAFGLEISSESLKDHYLAVDEDGDLIFNKKPCPLLVENRCSTYEHRPEDCRSYPHLHKNGFTSRLIQVVQDCSVCPIIFNVYELLKDELEFTAGDTWDLHS